MQTQIDRFRQMLENRAAVAIDQATDRSRIWRTLSEIMVGLTALMFCSSSALFSNAGCSTRWFA